MTSPLNSKTTTRRISTYARISIFLVALLLLGALGRVGQLKLYPNPELGTVEGARLATTHEPRYRGTVFDRMGRTLAIDKPAWRLAIDPNFFLNHGYERLIRSSSDETDVQSVEFRPVFDNELADLVGPLALAREHLRATRFHHLAQEL